MEDNAVHKLGCKEIQAYIKSAIELGRQRKANFGDNFNQSDFIAGASCILAFLKRMDMMPTGWVLGPMMGHDVFAKREKVNAE